MSHTNKTYKWVLLNIINLGGCVEVLIFTHSLHSCHHTPKASSLLLHPISAEQKEKVRMMRHTPNRRGPLFLEYIYNVREGAMWPWGKQWGLRQLQGKELSTRKVHQGLEEAKVAPRRGRLPSRSISSCLHSQPCAHWESRPSSGSGHCPAYPLGTVARGYPPVLDIMKLGGLGILWFGGSQRESLSPAKMGWMGQSHAGTLWSYSSNYSTVWTDFYECVISSMFRL